MKNPKKRIWGSYEPIPVSPYIDEYFTGSKEVGLYETILRLAREHEDYVSRHTDRFVPLGWGVVQLGLKRAQTSLRYYLIMAIHQLARNNKSPLFDEALVSSQELKEIGDYFIKESKLTAKKLKKGSKCEIAQR